MGHQTCASLFLSVLFASYKLARAAHSEPLQTGRSVREELESCSSLVLCLEANLRFPRSEICYSSDASLTGGAITLRSTSVCDVSHIGRLRETVDSNAKKKKPSHLASTHSPLARQSTQRLSTMMTTMIDSSCCVNRVRYLKVLRPSKSFLKFRVIVSFLSICRQSRRSDGSMMRTFFFSKPDQRLTQHATLVCESRNPHGYSLLDDLGLVLALDRRSKFPQLHVEKHLAQSLRVTDAARSQVLFPLDSIRIEQQRRWMSFFFRFLSM